MLARITVGLAAALLTAGCSGCASSETASVRPGPENLPSRAAAAPRPTAPGVVFVPETPRALDPAAFAEADDPGLVVRAVGAPLFDEGELPPIPGGEGYGAVEFLEDPPYEEPLEPGVDDGIGYEEEWPAEEWVVVEEVRYCDPVVVPADTIHLGMPVLVVEGWGSTAYGSFPAIRSAPVYDPCAYRPLGDWWNAGYDPCWDPVGDPAYRSWESYAHEWSVRHGHDHGQDTAPLAEGEDGTVAVVTGRGGWTEVSRTGPTIGPFPTTGGGGPPPPAAPPPSAGGGSPLPDRGAGAFGESAGVAPRGEERRVSRGLDFEDRPAVAAPRPRPTLSPATLAFRTRSRPSAERERERQRDPEAPTAPPERIARRPAPDAPAPVVSSIPAARRGGREDTAPRSRGRESRSEPAPVETPAPRRAAAAAAAPAPDAPARFGRSDPQPPPARRADPPERPSRAERSPAPRQEPPARRESPSSSPGRADPAPAPAPASEPPPSPPPRESRGGGRRGR